MKLQHSSKSGGAVATVWYSKEFLYSVWQDGTVCTRQAVQPQHCCHCRSSMVANI